MDVIILYILIVINKIMEHHVMSKQNLHQKMILIM